MVNLKLQGLLGSRRDLARGDGVFGPISRLVGIKFLTLEEHVAQIRDLPHLNQGVFINIFTHGLVLPTSLIRLIFYFTGVFWTRSRNKL